MAVPSTLRDAFNTHMRNLIATAGLNETSAEHQFGEMLAFLGEEQRKLARAAGAIWPKKVFTVMNLEAFSFSTCLLELTKLAQDAEGEKAKPVLDVIEGGRSQANDEIP